MCFLPVPYENSNMVLIMRELCWGLLGQKDSDTTTALIRGSQAEDKLDTPLFGVIPKRDMLNVDVVQLMSMSASND